MNNTGLPGLRNVFLSGLRFRNATGVNSPSGVGIAIEVKDDPTVASGQVYHIKLENLDISNFATGILLESVFDVLVENCQVSECQIGLRIESIGTVGVNENASQIKVFGGFFVHNQYHVSVDNTANRDDTGDIFLYGWSCGHQRTGIAGGAEGVGLYKGVAGVSLFGCHLEDLAHGIQVYRPTPSTFIGVLTVVGCMIDPIQFAGIEGGTNAALGTLTAIGNRFGPTTVPFLNTPNVQNGVMVGGNTPSSSNASNYPKTGYVEVSPTSPPGTIDKIAFRVSSFTNSTRPDPTTVLPGTIIYNTETNQLNVMENGVWVAV